ncbi:MAG: hypothetical protein ACRDV9_09400, partial [Acidimicrobiia bacterium]
RSDPSMLVVDDALLLSVLAGGAGAEIESAIGRGELHTTGSWYYRLGRALHDPRSSGSLSSAMAALPAERRARVLAGLDVLPPQIGLISLRHLVPVMARLPLDRRVNFLTAEAVAAARMLGARIQVTVESPVLREACQALGIDLEVMVR